MNEQEKIYALQAALRACLAVLYDVEDAALEPSRVTAIDQAHEALDAITPERPEFPVYYDAQGREHAEF